MPSVGGGPGMPYVEAPIGGTSAGGYSIPGRSTPAGANVHVGEGIFGAGSALPRNATGGIEDNSGEEPLGRRNRRRKYGGGGAGGGGGGGQGEEIPGSEPPPAPQSNSLVTVSLSLDCGWFNDIPAAGSLVRVASVSLVSEHLGTLTVDSITSAGDWLDQAGGSDIATSLNDASDATYAELSWDGATVPPTADWTLVAPFGLDGESSLAYSLGALTLHVRAEKRIATNAGISSNSALAFTKDAEQQSSVFFLGFSNELITASFADYTYSIDLSGNDV